MKRVTNSFVVVSDYGWLPENIEDSWVHKDCENYLLLDKMHRFKESKNVRHQKNVGQNVYDMFDFIVNNYDNLPNQTLFCRACLMFPKGRKPPLSNGNISEDYFYEIANSTGFTELHDFWEWSHTSNASRMGPDKSFEEINNSWYFNHHPPKYYGSLNHFLQDIYKDPELPSFIRFAPGCNYIIPKENILRNPKKLYEHIRNILSYDVVIGEAHMLERALYTIFNNDYEAQDKYKD